MTQDNASVESDKWLIWSNEHDAYWKPDSRGYTKSRSKAGRYSLSDAVNICQGANMSVQDDFPPMETLLPDSQ